MSVETLNVPPVARQPYVKGVTVGREERENEAWESSGGRGARRRFAGEASWRGGMHVAEA